MTAESTDDETNAKLLECSHCPKTFKYNSERIRHEISHSPGFVCDICYKKFSFVSALRRHQKQHQRTASAKCDLCQRMFRDEVLLKRHMKYAHEGTYACAKCSSVFNSEQALSVHAKSHRPESERRFKCSHSGCRKSFNFSHHLKHHELTHTNVKQHYCSVCGKGFIQSYHLKIHLKSHDPSGWHYCEFSGCKKKFTTIYAMKRHMRRRSHRVKPDSGISSDSNSCDASSLRKENAEDFILCASCGESVHQSDIVKHSTKCSDILDISATNDCIIGSSEYKHIIDKPVLTNIRTIEENLVKGKDNMEENNIRENTSIDNYLKHSEVTVIDKDVGDCNSAVGSCIMGANNCICAQMSKPNDENYDFTPITNTNNARAGRNTVNTNNIDFDDRYSEDISFFIDNNEVVGKKADVSKKSAINTKFTNSISSICDGCECASTCTIKEPANCKGNKNVNLDVSNVHTVKGVVKIKDTFDIDILIKAESANKANTNVNRGSDGYVQFSTCRDVIGNCIVGGNEGCLCARMMIDEQPATAQEIEDITPVPKNACA